MLLPSARASSAPGPGGGPAGNPFGDAQSAGTGGTHGRRSGLRSAADPEAEDSGGRGPGGGPEVLGSGIAAARSAAGRHARRDGLRQSQQRPAAFRGGASFTLGNSAFDAKPYSLNGQDIAKASYAASRFSLVGGGALHIPKLFTDGKTFFFASYFGTRSRRPFDSISTVPSLPERSGDFSESVARVPVTVFDPTTQQPFPGNSSRPAGSPVRVRHVDVSSLCPIYPGGCRTTS